MECKSTSTLMTVLRAEDERADWKLPQELLEKHLNESVFDIICSNALTVDLGCDLEDLRNVERAIVAAAVAAALKRDQELKEEYSDDGIEFSDEE